MLESGVRTNDSENADQWFIRFIIAWMLDLTIINCIIYVLLLGAIIAISYANKIRTFSIYDTILDKIKEIDC